MSSPKLEEFMAWLYTDAGLRGQFLQDMAGTATNAGLTAEEVTAMCQVDLADLQIAAECYAKKREGQCSCTLLQKLRRLVFVRTSIHF